MKKLKRAAEKFGVLELFADMATEYGYDLNDTAAHEEFINRVRVSLENSKKNNITIFGKRIETLFAYVAGALGKVILLKQEDAGDIYFTEDNVLPPDYRLTFDNNEQILVEVKNFHQKDARDNFIIHKEYYKKLLHYSELNQIELRFAVFFSSWNIWTLLSIDSFLENEKSYYIDFARAMACSEMARLGDCSIGVAPDLELQFFADATEASPIDELGTALFTTRQIKLYCAGQEIVDAQEQKIAFYLIQFGTWKETWNEAIVDDNKVIGLKFVFSPEKQDDENFAFIGLLSTMVTNGFRNHTVKNGDVVSLKLGLDPSVFKVLIPSDYDGKQLPLWRFVLKPNPDFKGIIDSER